MSTNSSSSTTASSSSTTASSTSNPTPNLIGQIVHNHLTFKLYNSTTKKYLYVSDEQCESNNIVAASDDLSAIAGRASFQLQAVSGKEGYYYLYHPVTQTYVCVSDYSTQKSSIGDQHYFLTSATQKGVPNALAVNCEIVSDTAANTFNFHFWGGDYWYGMGVSQAALGSSGSATIVEANLKDTSVRSFEIIVELAATTAFKQKAYPLDFSLLDSGQQPVMYIQQGDAANTMNLSLMNTSSYNLQFQPGSSSTPSASHYHLALQFRPGTLTNAAKITLKQAPQDWLMSASEDSTTGITTLYFLNSPVQTLAPASAGSQLLTFQLDQLCIDAAGGSRTTRVQMLYQGLILGTQTTAPVSGVREQVLNLIDHMGKQHIPLYLETVGLPMILNDGQTPNDLTLRVCNIGLNTIVFNGPEAKATTGESKLIISFDAGSQPWDLATSDQIAGATVAMTATSSGGSSAWQMTPPDSQAKLPQWTFTPKQNTNLAPNASLEFSVTGLVSGNVTGQAHGYVHYQDIPGYWDGQLLCTIQKTPISVQGQNVGINAMPQAASEGDQAASEGNLFVEAYHNILPIGTILMWYGSEDSIPPGWVLCNGQNNTPDLQNRFIVGAGNNYGLNDTGGAEDIVLNVDQIPAHSHSIDLAHDHSVNDPGHSHQLSSNNYGFHIVSESSGSEANNLYQKDNNHEPLSIETSYTGISVNSALGDEVTNETGGSQSHENRPPYYALYYIMKAVDSESVNINS